MTLFEHFFHVLSRYLEARIRIRIKVTSRIRIRIRVRIGVMLIRNTDCAYLIPYRMLIFQMLCLPSISIIDDIISIHKNLLSKKA
jgi:hypothetical protein